MPTVARRYASSEGPFERPSSRQDAQGRAPVVLLVSGGADSTALLVLAATSALDIDDGRGQARIARERLHVLHINHQLRGLDAEEDEEYVRELAGRFGIPCTVRRVDVAALAEARPDGNVENAGREVRYAAARELANALSDELGTPRGAARIVTAHTADDRAETFLMNAVRGSGAAGLSSIPRRRNRIVRPLLDRTHEELCELLRMRGIVWREDATNADTSRLRAFIRHEILPLARERNPRVIASLSSACDILSDEDAYLTQVSARALRDLTRRQEEGLIALDAGRLSALEVAIARRIVRQAILLACPECRLEARHIERVLAIVAAGSGSATAPMGIDCRVAHGLLIVRTRAAERGAIAAWLDVPGELELPGGAIISARTIAVAPGSSPADVARAHGREWAGSSVLLDAEAAGLTPEGGSLWVDAPQAGDVCCPLGMHGQSKKVSDLLNEARVAAADKASVAIVRTAPTGKIAWIAGIRADERFKCGARTKVLLELSLRTDA